MTTSLTRAIALTAVAAALLVAGCGSDSKENKSDSYKSDYTAQSAKIKSLGEEIGTTITGADKLTDAQVETKFGALAKRTHDAAKALLALTPPDDLTVDNATLATALEKAAKDLDDIVTAAKAGDVEGAKSATITLANDSVAVKTARDALNAATK